jgi:phosphate transport system substrate-binding protein
VLVRAISGLGDALPVAANDSEDGRRKNRRVEVWVY